jgi:Big-like domain-containing protein
VRDQVYFFQVAAIDKVGQRSLPTPTVTVLTVDAEPPAAPVITEVTAHPVGNTLVVNWTATGDDLAGFGLYSNSSGSWAQVGLIASTQRTAVVPDLTDGVRAYVRISAFDTAGHEGPFSAVGSGVPADTQRPQPPPSIVVTAVPAGAALTVSWAASPDSDVVGYKVFFLDPSVGSNYQLVAVVDAPALNYTHRNLTNGASYRYRVAAFDEVPNEGASGPEAVGKPRDSIPPTAPHLSAVSSPTNIVNIPISGTAEPGLEVQIWVRATLQATVTADSAGHFQSEAKLIRGDNEIYAKAVDPSPVVDPAYKSSPPSQSIHVGLDPDKPTISSTIPAADANGVDPSLPLVISMNEGVRADSITFALRDPQGNEVPGNLSYEAARNILRFKPTSALKAGTTYKVELSATDLAGNAMTPTTFSFTTRPASTSGTGGGAPGPGALAAMAALGGVATLAVATRRRRQLP